jgi:predicted small lipoprotein YifL
VRKITVAMVLATLALTACGLTHPAGRQPDGHRQHQHMR